MNTKTITPPDIIRAIFPLQVNAHLVDDIVAAGYSLFVYPEHNTILFEGDPSTVDHAMHVFKGGARAY